MQMIVVPVLSEAVLGIGIGMHLHSIPPERAPVVSVSEMTKVLACMQAQQQAAHDVCKKIAELELEVWDAAMQAS